MGIHSNSGKQAQGSPRLGMHKTELVTSLVKSVLKHICALPPAKLLVTLVSRCWEYGRVQSRGVAVHMNWVIPVPALTGLGQLPHKGRMF